MIALSPTLDAAEAHRNLRKLLNTNIDVKHFRSATRRLQNRFKAYAATCPSPFIAPDLIVTPEIRRQSELYLPIAEITGIFNRLYRQALTYPPLLSSTRFCKALSWADVFVSLPAYLQFSVNPAHLLEALLSDRDLLMEFLFSSFLPHRFYGGFGRYPRQVEFIREWLGNNNGSCTWNNAIRWRCLDAACGTGECSYGLANLFMEAGFAPAGIQIEGWTLEPLEVWAAEYQCFPHDQKRQEVFRRQTSRLFERGYQTSIRFRCADLANIPLDPHADLFNLIFCNGLLGGPIINESKQMEQVVASLTSLLAPGGVLLAADSFHGGWKSSGSNVDLKVLFESFGLKSVDAGEGVGGLKS